MLDRLLGQSTAIDNVISGKELSFDDGMELMNDDNLHVLGAVADLVRQKTVGDNVTFASSYYMNYTNLCAASCQMCAFYRKGDEDDAYTLTPEQIEKRVAAAKEYTKDKVICLATAHPAKFPDAIQQAINQDPPVAPSIEKIQSLDTRCFNQNATKEDIQAFIEEKLR